ncbi:hypothetical protein [Prosthecobacter sp.]|jgi:hypothetical protein|uniref:hypothetical protein n=1 Tax=Prosthecobacter sp. TaxID=1965333 RepID=UPI00378447CE
MMLILALMLALPVGLEACSVPGTLDEADQPHALIGADDDMSHIDAQASDVPSDFLGLADLPAATSVYSVVAASMNRAETRWNVARAERGTRLHRRLCRELC